MGITLVEDVCSDIKVIHLIEENVRKYKLRTHTAADRSTNSPLVFLSDAALSKLQPIFSPFAVHCYFSRLSQTQEIFCSPDSQIYSVVHSPL